MGVLLRCSTCMQALLLDGCRLIATAAFGNHLVGIKHSKTRAELACGTAAAAGWLRWLGG